MEIADVILRGCTIEKILRGCLILSVLHAVSGRDVRAHESEVSEVYVTKSGVSDTQVTHIDWRQTSVVNDVHTTHKSWREELHTRPRQPSGVNDYHTTHKSWREELHTRPRPTLLIHLRRNEAGGGYRGESVQINKFGEHYIKPDQINKFGDHKDGAAKSLANHKPKDSPGYKDDYVQSVANDKQYSPGYNRKYGPIPVTPTGPTAKTNGILFTLIFGLCTVFALFILCITVWTKCKAKAKASDRNRRLLPM